MRTFHWLGAGLSSGPGIRFLSAQRVPVVLWNRTLRRAYELFPHGASATVEVREYELNRLSQVLRKGDVVVSMLPAPMHVDIARVCLERRAHLVTTSYVSPAMQELDAVARERGVTLLNEAGLDPGIDHLFAHELVNSLKASAAGKEADEIEFESLCGGVPAAPCEFAYKFSWSPAGVLRALKNSARFIDDGQEHVAEKAWLALFEPTISGERFEAYPNRDSVSYLPLYHFVGPWKVKRFVRGTLRPRGWRQAWDGILQRVQGLSDAQIETLALELWEKHRYRSNEFDRVLLSVRLRAFRRGELIFDRSHAIDEVGDENASAMGRLVSLPAALAALWVNENAAPRGVCGLPSETDSVASWMQRLTWLGIQSGPAM